jgi:predicted transcriptional regulator
MTELEFQLIMSRRTVLEKLADEILASDCRSHRVKLIRLRHIKKQLEEIMKQLEAPDNGLA